MFLPIRTDRQLKHTPWVNHGLIAINVLVFLFTHGLLGHYDMMPWIFDPVEPATWHGIPYPLITYQFLHGDWMHLLGNMLFLWVFGNSVEDRLGKIGYLCFYLAGGVLAGLGHWMLEVNPVLGASGSVCAVTGAYLALFPMSQVTIFYWFIFIGTFELASLYLILFQIAQNLVFHFMGNGGVAYGAHLAGYVYGFLVGMCLLWSRLLPREPYDLLSMLEHRRRRAQFQALARQGYQPWESGLAQNSTIPGKPETPAVLSAHEQRLTEARQKVSLALSAGDLPLAARHYQHLLAIDPAQVMPQQQQLDLANQLMADQAHTVAAKAYELFLSTFNKYPQREQVELILALIYVRYLSRGQRARELLTSALPRLVDPQQRQLAQQMLDQLK